MSAQGNLNDFSSCVMPKIVTKFIFLTKLNSACVIELFLIFILYTWEGGHLIFFFLQNNLHNISTHPVYNHKTITFDSLFLHRVEKQDNCTSIFLYSQHTDKSIHTLSLFKHNL